MRVFVAALASAAVLFGLGGCDWVAQRELRVGESTEAEVRKLMGQPGLIWEESDGIRVLEYARAPEGQETYMVTIGADGRYRGMVNVLVDTYFDRVGPGMSLDDVRRLLGPPTETAYFERRRERVWSWRHLDGEGRHQMFHVVLNGLGRVAKVSRGPDERMINMQ